jgi:ABC-type branched-subunit amino acid transport system ATPase component
MPIIGVNESGKTTILHAIFAFDHFNDDSNDGGRHLGDVSNLYRSSSPAATVEAEVETTPSELRMIFSECAVESPGDKNLYDELTRRKKLPSKLTILRTITTRKYSLPTEYFGNEAVQDTIARRMMRRLPYILYFDDFRDKIAERIEIPQNTESSPGEWFDILEQLFTHTDKSYSLYELANMEVRQRKTVLSHVQRRLNETLTRGW